MYHIT